MQIDGNLVEYGATAEPLWASDTSKHPGNHLALQEDGNLVVYDKAGKALWASRTELPPAPPLPTVCGRMNAGQGLTVGESLSACGDDYALSMEADGNLVLYRTKPERKAIWATETNGKAGFNAILRADGNFALYDIHDHVIWSSGTGDHPGSSLAVQGEGNLVIYESLPCDAGGDCTAALWSSNAAGE
jgi:hypothetical protein